MILKTIEQRIGKLPASDDSAEKSPFKRTAPYSAFIGLLA